MKLEEFLRDERGWILPLLIGAGLVYVSRCSSSSENNEYPTVPTKIIKAKESWWVEYSCRYPELFLRSDNVVDVWTCPKGQKPTKDNGAKGWTNISLLHRTYLTWWDVGTRITVENNGDVDTAVSLGVWGKCQAAGKRE